MLHRNAYHSFVLVLVISFTVNACVISTEPLLGPESRVLPFASPKRFRVYARDAEQDPWIRKEDVTLVADEQLEVRDERYPNAPGLIFHSDIQGRFLVQAHLDSHYRYGVLDVRNGEGILKWIGCAKIDQEAFRTAGGTVVRAGKPDAECHLDTASNPLELLKSISARASGFEQRYVPVFAPRIPGGQITQQKQQELIEQREHIKHVLEEIEKDKKLDISNSRLMRGLLEQEKEFTEQLKKVEQEIDTIRLNNPEERTFEQRQQDEIDRKNWEKRKKQETQTTDQKRMEKELLAPKEKEQPTHTSRRWSRHPISLPQKTLHQRQEEWRRAQNPSKIVFEKDPITRQQQKALDRALENFENPDQ
jgi:hypothetical protein